MGTTTSSLATNTIFPKTFEIFMVGLDGAGKTSIINRLSRDALPRGVLPVTTPTIAQYAATITRGRHTITLTEFGGNDKIRPLWRCYFWNAHAFIFALDASAAERYPEAREELHRICNEDALKYPLLVLANKRDRQEAGDLARISDALGLDEIVARHREWPIAVKCVSAMTGQGLDEVVEWFVQNVSHQLIAVRNKSKKDAS